MIGIKDMEMPKSCDMCDFNSCGYPRQYCEFPGCGWEVTDYIASKDIDCPLFEIEDKEKIDVD